MSRIWMMLVVGVSLSATLFWATPAKAVPLSNTNVSWDTFLDWTDSDSDSDNVPDPVPGFGPLFTPYEFEKEGSPLGDGTFFSWVFVGTGDAAGLYVYVYQIQVLRTPNIEGASLVFITDPTATPVGDDGVTSFYIGSGTPTIGLGPGTYAPEDADWLSVAEGGEPTLRFNEINVPPDGISYIFGTFSPLPPTAIDISLRDGGDPLVRPLAYVPTPEPSTFVLLSTSLIGLIAFPFRRRLKGRVECR